MSTTLKEAIAKRKIHDLGRSYGIDPAFLEVVIRHISAEIKGEKGEKGERGDFGPQGRKGDKGDSIQGPRGEKGEKGDAGNDGRDAIIDEDRIVKLVIARLELPKDGKDGTDAKVDEKMLRKIVKEEIEERVGKKKMGVKDIVGLPETIKSMRDLSRNFGGHGGTMQKITATGIGNMQYNLSKTVNPLEIQVFVGGARLFEENGDFSYPAGGHISQITLAAQFDVQVQSGTLLNVRGK